MVVRLTGCAGTLQINKTMKKVQKVLNLVVEDSNYDVTAEPKAKAKAKANAESAEEPVVKANAEGLKKASASRYIGNKVNDAKKALAEVTGYGKFLGVKKVPKVDANGKAVVRAGKPVITCVWNIASAEGDTLTVFSSWGFYESNQLRAGSIVNYTYEAVEEGDSFERDGVETIAEGDFLSLRNISVGDLAPYFRAVRKYLRSEITDADELQDELDMMKEEQKLLTRIALNLEVE